MPDGPYVIDTSAVLAVLVSGAGADKVVSTLRAAARQEARAMVPFTVMAELELELLRHAPGHIDQVLALVEAWPVEIVESYPQWRHEAVRLQAAFKLPAAIAWAASLALLHSAQLVHQDPAFEAIPGLAGIKLA